MMDTLHNVMRSISGERKSERRSESGRDHLTVFREFLDHLDRAAKKKARVKTPKTKARRRR